MRNVYVQQKHIQFKMSSCHLSVCYQHCCLIANFSLLIDFWFEYSMVLRWMDIASKSNNGQKNTVFYTISCQVCCLKLIIALGLFSLFCSVMQMVHCYVMWALVSCLKHGSENRNLSISFQNKFMRLIFVRLKNLPFFGNILMINSIRIGIEYVTIVIQIQKQYQFRWLATKYCQSNECNNSDTHI